MGFGVTHHPQLCRQFDPWLCVKLCEIRLAEGRQNFAGAVGAEVEAKETILRPQPGIISDHTCRNELVGLTLGIGLRDHLLRGGGFWTLGLCDGCECGFNTLPTIIAIQGVIATNHRANTRALRQAVLQSFKITFGRAGADIAAICDGVNDNWNIHPR